MSRQLETLMLVHHSHTDIGFTHDQPIVWDQHLRFLDEALELADRHSDSEADSAFRWTVESTLVLKRWLEEATPNQVERFRALEKAGRIEVTGMYLNLTPLFDTDQLLETFQVLRSLRRDYGFDIRYGMNCDVNGHNWPLVDTLLDLEFEGFAMAINQHFGGAPFVRPNAFWWEAPSGRKLLTWNSWTYDTGWRFGMVHDEEAFEQQWIPRIRQHLQEIDHPFPALMIQSYHPFGDNGSGFLEYSSFIESWNRRGKTPRLQMITPRQWWDVVKRHSDRLPTYRGDWTDFWNFGCLSSARETRINRASRTRLRVSDALAATCGSTFDHGSTRLRKRRRDQAWESVHLYDEHTWGADCAVRDPYCEDTDSQWSHKSHCAFHGRSLSLALQRDALAALARRVAGGNPDLILIHNPLPFGRRIHGPISKWVLEPRGVPEDGTAGRHFQDRQAKEVHLFGSEGDLPPRLPYLQEIEVPGFGYRVVDKTQIFHGDWQPQAPSEVVENEHFRLTFDLKTGGLRSWFDKRWGKEWVNQDGDSPWPLNGFVHERVDTEPDHPWPRREVFAMEWNPQSLSRPRAWRPNWQARREGPWEVVQHLVLRSPFATRVYQKLRAPGCVGELVQTTLLCDHSDVLDCTTRFVTGLDSHPQANYLVFPFALERAQVRFDVGGQAVQPEADQLPGTCRDYFTVQNWVDFHNGQEGMLVGTPDNPMVQLGGFTFAQDQDRFELQRATLLGWLTNNYWETNFRAHQPGATVARYRLQPYRGEFCESRAHRFGLESRHGDPLAQHLGESALGEAPYEGQLLVLPEPPIQVLSLQPWEGKTALLRLLNATDSEQSLEVGSGLLSLDGARHCNLLGEVVSELLVQEGTLRHVAPPRRVTVLQLDLR